MHSFMTLSDATSYDKTPKSLDIRNIYSNRPKIWRRWLYYSVMWPKDADRMANSVDPDQIWIYTVCSDLSVRKLRIITVIIAKFDMMVLNHTDICMKDAE